jgi:hypothetical protein
MWTEEGRGGENCLMKDFVFVLFAKCYGGHIKDQRDGVCSLYGF